MNRASHAAFQVGEAGRRDVQVDPHAVGSDFEFFVVLKGAFGCGALPRRTGVGARPHTTCAAERSSAIRSRALLAPPDEGVRGYMSRGRHCIRGLQERFSHVAVPKMVTPATWV